MARWVKSMQQMKIFKTSSAPTVLQGVAIGDLWINTNSTATINVCTAITPSVTFATAADTGSAAVTGPNSSTTNAIAIYADTTGAVLLNSGVIIDTNNNLSANVLESGYQTTATAAATTTLTVASTQQQFFTGSTTQTCLLPVTSTLSLGFTYTIVNNSTGIVTVQSSGANTIVAMAAATKLIVTCILTSGTTAVSWDYNYQPNASSITGSGSLVRSTSPTLITPVLGAASATSLAFSSTSGIIGSTTNDSAATGSVGEYVSSTVLSSGSPVSLTTTTITAITSLSLSAGDWNVWGNVYYIPATGTTLLNSYNWISTDNGTLPDPAIATYQNVVQSSFASSGGATMLPPMVRISLTGTTTVYLLVRPNFSVSTLTGAGFIAARRIR